MNKLNIFLLYISNIIDNIVGIIYLSSPPKPYSFTVLPLQSSLGGFNECNLISFNQLIFLIENILQNSLGVFNEYNLFNFNQLSDLIHAIPPYILPLTVLINRIRMPSIGCSINSSDTGIINTDNVQPTLSQLPNSYVVLDPIHQWYIVLLDFINSPFVSLALMGSFIFMIRGVARFSITTLNTNNFVFILSILFLLIPSTLAYEEHMGIVANNPFIYYTVITTILFYLSNLAFDYYSAQHRLRGIIYLNSNIITRIFLGLLYLLNITSGVFSTNGVWYLLNNYHTGVITIFTTLGAILFPMLWFIAGMENRLINGFFFNSMWRAIFEVLSFNCVAFSTYMYWDFWLTHVTAYPYWIGFGLFTSLLLPVGFITIYLESRIGRGRGLIYGIFYLLTFTCIAMSTNSVFALISEHVVLLYINVILAIINSLLTVGLYPDIYRAGVLMTRSYLAHILLSNSEILNGRTWFDVFTILEHLILFYLVFLSFVLYTGLIFVYIYNWLILF